MLKRTFGVFVAVASLAFALFFAISVIQTRQQPVEDERAEKVTTVNDHSGDGFRLETLVGSILTGIQ